MLLITIKNLGMLVP